MPGFLEGLRKISKEVGALLIFDEVITQQAFRIGHRALRRFHDREPIRISRMIPLMSVMRNFFMGREPIRRIGPLRFLDVRLAEKVTYDEMLKIGIDVRDPQQAVGTLSGGERQCVAIARAVYFGAKVLILDEPTSALGVRQTAIVLQHIHQMRAKNLGVIFITHNVRHAYAVGDRFTVLNRGRTLESRKRGEVSIDELQNLMAGGKELTSLSETLGGTV